MQEWEPQKRVPKERKSHDREPPKKSHEQWEGTKTPRDGVRGDGTPKEICIGRGPQERESPREGALYKGTQENEWIPRKVHPMRRSTRRQNSGKGNQKIGRKKKKNNVPHQLIPYPPIRISVDLITNTRQNQVKMALTLLPFSNKIWRS